MTPTPSRSDRRSAPSARQDSVGAIAQRAVGGVKAGDVGVLPVVVGLIVDRRCSSSSQNTNFLTAGNFTT